MNHRKRMITIGMVAWVGLVACGGGSVSGSDSNAAGSATDLYAVYERIANGMSYAAVSETAGMAHNGGEQLLPTEGVYRWETGRNTASFTVLSVTIDTRQGVIQKVVNGPRGLRSQSY